MPKESFMEARQDGIHQTAVCSQLDVLECHLAFKVDGPLLVLVWFVFYTQGEVQFGRKDRAIHKSDRPNVEGIEEYIQIYWDLLESNSWIDVVLRLVKLEFKAKEV